MRILFFALAPMILASCSGQLLRYEEKDFEKHGSYQEELKVEVVATPTPSPTPESKKEVSPKPTPTPEPTPVVVRAETNEETAKKKKQSPFRVGEKVVIEMTYMGVRAGQITFSVLPMVKVNDRLAYAFSMEAQSIKLFEMVYRVKNAVKTFVDKKTLLPFSFELDVNESKRVRQARAIFDLKKKEVRYWEKYYEKKSGLKQIEEKWPLEQESQNAYSAVFTFRAFDFKVDKVHKQRVVHNKELIDIEYHVLGKEVVKNSVGSFDTIIVQPKLYKKGKLEEKTDVKFWLTDDHRRMIVKIKADVKIGSLNGELVTYQP